MESLQEQKIKEYTGIYDELIAKREEIRELYRKRILAAITTDEINVSPISEDLNKEIARVRARIRYWKDPEKAKLHQKKKLAEKKQKAQ